MDALTPRSWDSYSAELKGKTREEFNTRNRNMIEPSTHENGKTELEADKPGTRQVTSKAHGLNDGPKPPWAVYNKMARINHRDAQRSDRREARLAAAARKDQVKEAQKARDYEQSGPENDSSERE